MADNIEFIATATEDITPKWTFTGETIDVWVDGVDKGDLTSDIEATIPVVLGNVISYRTTGNWSGVTRVDMRTDPISGNIASLSQLTSLTRLYIHLTSVFGNISVLSGLTSLVHLFLYSTSVFGNISVLSGLTLLTYLSIYRTSVSGDANCLDTQVSMVDFRADDCSWTQTEVDNVLASLVVNEAAGAPGRNCIVTIGNGNSPPSWKGWGDKLTLVSKGWTVTINIYVFTDIGLSCHLWMKMNDNSDDSFVIDYSSKGNHGTLYALNSPPDPYNLTSNRHVDSGNPPYLNGALAMDESRESHILVGTMGNFGSNMDEVTVTAWINNWGSGGAPNRALLGIVGVSPFFFMIRINKDSLGDQFPGAILCTIQDNDSSELAFAVDENTGVIDGNSHFICIVIRKSSGTGEIWVDNVKQTVTYALQGTGINFSNFTRPLGLAALSTGFGQTEEYSSVDLDVMGIFDKALSEVEIAFLWNNGMGTEILRIDQKLTAGLKNQSLIARKVICNTLLSGEINVKSRLKAMEVKN